LRPEYFRDPPGAVATLQLHLEQAFLRMDETDTKSDIFIILCSDQRDTVGITLDPDLGSWSRQHDPSVGLGQRRAEIKVEPADEES